MRIVYFFVLLLHFCHCFNDRHSLRINRPCSLYDHDCIRDYFTENFNCVPTKGNADPYIPDKISLDVPHANITFILNKPRITGLNNAKIKEFYINEDTGVLILEVEFESIRVDTPICFVTYYRKGKEPLITADYTGIDYKDISMTYIIPGLHNYKEVLNPHTYTYISDRNPQYVLGPNIYKTKDREFQRAINEAEMKVDLTLKELFVAQGPKLFDKYFRSNFCTFVG